MSSLHLFNRDEQIRGILFPTERGFTPIERQESLLLQLQTKKPLDISVALNKILSE
jgi:hypothetical protein